MSLVAAASPLMAEDMAEQTVVLRRLVANRETWSQRLRMHVRERPRGVVLVGRGSSENAALLGRAMLETTTRLPAMLLPPSLLRLYRTTPDLDGYLAIGLSQSGHTPEIVQTLGRLRDAGALTLAITTDPVSPLGASADLVLDLQTGWERAVPATKTFTAEVAALGMVAETLGEGAPLSSAAWEAMVDAVDGALRDPSPPRLAACRLDGVEHVFVIAAGMSVGLAHETALKIMEVSRIAASAFSCVSFLHGPITIAGPRHPVIALAVPGFAEGDVLRISERLGGVPTIMMAGLPSADVVLPSGLPEALGAIPAAIRAQQLALELALRRRLNPDHPPRIEKVTTS